MSEFVQDRVWKKLKGWKEKFLTAAGRETLIESVAQFIHTYIMGYVLLPASICDHLESMISKFRWGSKQGERKIHWVSWNKLYQKKSKGGMRIRSFWALNEALLAKQGWKILTQPNSFLSQCLKAKNFSSTDILHASEGYSPSFTWKSIWHATWIIKKCGFWKIGNGSHVNI